MEFDLDARLESDSHFIADGPLSQLRLIDDTRFPWLVLVPRLPGATEWLDLDGSAQRLLLAEINLAGKLLRATGRCDKINIGALGNIVRQLHVHVVAPTEGDAAWPGPVWGSGLPGRHDPSAFSLPLATLPDYRARRVERPDPRRRPTSAKIQPRLKPRRRWSRHPIFLLPRKWSSLPPRKRRRNRLPRSRPPTP